eukprot:6448577-Amphidinium_carterae.1
MTSVVGKAAAATPVRGSSDLRQAWQQAFVAGQEKLVAAERLLPQIHLLPLAVLNSEETQSTAMVEVLVAGLVWGELGLPQDRLEFVLLCVPLHALTEDLARDPIGLTLYGNGKEMLGDCNCALLLADPSTLTKLLDVVPSEPAVEILTFAEHAQGGVPRSAEAYAHWSPASDFELRSLAFLDLDSDTLKAIVAGQPLDDDVYLSAEEDVFEGDFQRAVALLGAGGEGPRVTLPLTGPSAKVLASARVGAVNKKGAPSVASQPPGGLGAGPSNPRTSLLAEQQVHGLAQKMREAKAKAAAKSQEVGEIASALLQGMQQLGDRLSRLESQGITAAPTLHSPPPCLSGSTMGAARPVPARPIAPACVGAGPQFGASVGAQLLPGGRGLLSPREGAGLRSYQTALSQAQQHLLPATTQTSLAQRGRL